MKTIIFGHRGFFDIDPKTDDVVYTDTLIKMSEVMTYVPWKITETVCGCAAGADTCGKLWAQENGIPTVHFPADWNKYKKAAGPIRNKQMGDYGEAGVGFLAPGSKGTANMIAYLRKLKKPLMIYHIDTEEITIEYDTQAK